MWEIYAYQNADSLFGIFNAIAAMFGAGDYRATLAAVAFCGFTAALIAYGFAPEKLQGWKWLGSVVLVFSLLIAPKVTVGIVDKTGGAPVKIVANVPFGMALFGAVSSNIGNTLTGLFETAFQTIPGPGALPAELAYQKNGLMFGNRLIRATRNVVFQDPQFRTDLLNFIRNCTFYDLLDGALDPAAFARSGDVWPLMASPNPARFSPRATSAGAVTVETCPAVYVNLNGRIPAQIDQLQGKLAFQLNPTLPGPAAAAVIAGQIQQAYLKDNLADAAASAASLIRQNALINAVDDSAKLSGQTGNDPAAVMLAVGRAQALAQTNAAWINSGKVAEQALPVLRNVIEALAYALFPLFVLLLLLTSGRDTMLALKSYIAILIWIQLWPPLYAVLNYMASIYAAYDLAAAADVGGGVKALSLQTASPIYANAIAGEAVVGYLVLSVPLIAWAALKRMENFGTALVGGLSALQASLGSASGAAANGNVNLGNVAMDQMQLAPNRTSAFMQSWQDNASGNTFSSNVVNGRTGVSLLRNQGFASRVASVRVSQQDVSEASQQVSAARNEAVSANTERAAVLADTLSKGLAHYHASRNSSGASSGSFEQTGENLNRLDQITKGVADKTGLTQSQVAQIAFGAAAHAGANVLVGAEIRASGGKSYQSGLSSDQQKVLGSMTSSQIAEFKQFGDRVSHDASFLHEMGSDARDGHDLSARLSTATARSERADATLAERTAFAERISAAREHGETIAIDLAQDPHNTAMFLRYAEQYGASSAAAFAMFDAELARQSLGPNRVFSDGAALPASFGDIRAQHAQDAADPRLHPNLTALDHAQRAHVSSFHATASGKDATAAPVNPVRHAIETEGAKIRAETQAGNQQFDTAADIVKHPDGTLASKKSLLVQTGKQVAGDGGATMDNAKDIVKDLLKKK